MPLVGFPRNRTWDEVSWKTDLLGRVLGELVGTEEVGLGREKEAVAKQGCSKDQTKPHGGQLWLSPAREFWSLYLTAVTIRDRGRRESLYTPIPIGYCLRTAGKL